MHITPYLIFGGRCDEALACYRTILGAQIELLMRYNESPDPMPPGMLPAGWETKVMHTTFRIGDTTLMASDGCETGTTFGCFSLHVTVPTDAEADRVFAALAVDGQIRMPLTKTFWSPRFGMVKDRFGLGWMISVATNS